MFDQIKKDYIDSSLFLDNYCLGQIAIKKWNDLNPAKIDVFQASPGWIANFKRRWGLSTLRARYSKAVDCNEEEIKKFYLECDEIKYFDKKHIYNLDETFFRTIFANENVIGLKGSENRPVKTFINPKTGFTVVFLISADGSFHKPIVIGKGKTNKCLDKFGNSNKIHKKYSHNGWINISIMKFILNEIHRLSNDNDAVLIMDRYSVHLTDAVKEYADELGIRLIFVPTGATATNQPLDVSINGPVKSIFRKLIKNAYLLDQTVRNLLKQSVNALVTAKEKIKQDTIIKSFERACKI